MGLIFFITEKSFRKYGASKNISKSYFLQIQYFTTQQQIYDMENYSVRHMKEKKLIQF